MSRKRPQVSSQTIHAIWKAVPRLPGVLKIGDRLMIPLGPEIVAELKKEYPPEAIKAAVAKAVREDYAQFCPGSSGVIRHLVTYPRFRDWLNKQPRLKRRRATGPRPLTEKELKAYQTVAECQGNIAKAARQLGKDRKTVDEQYRSALRKLGKRLLPKPRTVPMPSDRRGQVNLADSEDQRIE